MLDLWLDLREQVDEFDVGGENQSSRGHRAEMELEMDRVVGIGLEDWNGE